MQRMAKAPESLPVGQFSHAARMLHRANPDVFNHSG